MNHLLRLFGNMKKYILFLAILAACNPVDCFKNRGDIVTETREVGSFKRILLNDNVDLCLTNQTGTSIQIEGGNKLLSKVKTSVQGDFLQISNDNECNWARSYEGRLIVYVGAKDLENIEYLGYGNIYCREQVVLNSNLNIFCEGTGDIDLNVQAKELSLLTKSVSFIQFSGTAQKLKVETNYALGKIHTEKMQAVECEVIHDYLNEIRVYPIQKLTVTISNKGNVFYYNEPTQVVTNITGDGRLIKN